MKTEVIEGPVYTKIEYSKAVNIKRDLLSLQMDLLNSVQTINSFREKRKKEMILNHKLSNDLRNIRADFKKITDESPKLKFIETKPRVEKKKEIKQEHKLDDIGQQLIDIRQRLQALK